MEITREFIAAEAYAQGRIDAGEVAFMDPDGFSSAATVGAFAYHYAAAAEAGHSLTLSGAWDVFVSEGGRTVVHTGDTDTHEDEMATDGEVKALRDVLDSGLCLVSRTFLGGRTYRCTLRLGHSTKKHVYAPDGKAVATWSTEESDQALADRIHFVPASPYSTLVTTTSLPPVAVATDEQVSTDVPAQEAR
jgi:hypothetical protein